MEMEILFLFLKGFEPWEKEKDWNGQREM